MSLDILFFIHEVILHFSFAKMHRFMYIELTLSWIFFGEKNRSSCPTKKNPTVTCFSLILSRI